ncbi:hypothetical protein HYH02_012341 [Chlamydomonas schloesseri]|uniref:Uncharacterized protein n=1 Tax=Chlamydomonas schloesseri TaxID=2026947 RepID=A0A835SW59_9CHLO|nr:hypothetical protein HYH02_012341 [Chlamydomonas schloesseri]|eukprot:KAG2434319.1 hypothetical protein HYH02_012341 [Chlamydomonas schloesseri]
MATADAAAGDSAVPMSRPTAALPSTDSVSLLTLPTHLLQQILVLAGPGASGAVRSCRQVREAWRAALRCAPLMAAFIAARCAPDLAGAPLWAYRPQVRAALLGFPLPVPERWSDPVQEPPPSPEADCAQLALMQALAAQQPGLSFLRSPSALLLAATRARHLLTLSWLTSGPSLGGGGGSSGRGGPWAHALSAISPRGHGGEALLAAVVECRCPHLAACLLEAGVSARAQDSAALIAACRPRLQQQQQQQGSLVHVEQTSAAAQDKAQDGDGGGGGDGGAEAQLALVRLLLKHGADPRVQGSLALTEAVRCGNLPLVELLLAGGANPLGADSRALREAAMAAQPQPELVRRLLEAGSQADALCGAALASVCRSPPPPPPEPSSAARALVGNESVAGEEEECCCATAEGGQQRCGCAAGQPLRLRLQLAEVLLAAGAQANAAALTYAAQWEAGSGLPLVRLLLAAREERSGPGSAAVLLAGGAALQAACRGGCVELVGELLAAGAAADGWALKAAVEGAAAARTAAIEAATSAISLAALRGGPYTVSLPYSGDSEDEGEDEGEGEGEEGRKALERPPAKAQGGSRCAKAAERAEFEALLARVKAAAAGPPGKAGSTRGGRGMADGAGRTPSGPQGPAAYSPGGGHDAVVELLLGAGADPMAEYGQVFMAAVRGGRWRMVGAMCCVPAGAAAAAAGAGGGCAGGGEVGAGGGAGGGRLRVMVGMCNNLPLKDAARLGWRRVVALLLAAGAGAEREVRECAAAEAGGYGHGRVEQLLLGWQ